MGHINTNSVGTTFQVVHGKSVNFELSVASEGLSPIYRH